MPGPTYIFGRFTDFVTDHSNDLEAIGHSKKDIENYPVSQLMNDIKQWARLNPRTIPGGV
jgi:hypothetical protein